MCNSVATQEWHIATYYWQELNYNVNTNFIANKTLIVFLCSKDLCCR